MAMSKNPKPLSVRFLGGNLFFSVGSLEALVMADDEAPVATCDATFGPGSGIDVEAGNVLPLLAPIDDAGAPGCAATTFCRFSNGAAGILVPTVVVADEMAGVPITFWGSFVAVIAAPTTGAERATTSGLPTGLITGFTAGLVPGLPNFAALEGLAFAAGLAVYSILTFFMPGGVLPPALVLAMAFSTSLAILNSCLLTVAIAAATMADNSAGEAPAAVAASAAAFAAAAAAPWGIFLGKLTESECVTGAEEAASVLLIFDVDLVFAPLAPVAGRAVADFFVFTAIFFGTDEVLDAEDFFPL
jgi:hypothetical protein